MPNPAERFPDNEITFRDRKGREQKGTIVETLGQPDRGVETVQDAMTLAWYAMQQDLARREKEESGE